MIAVVVMMLLLAVAAVWISLFYHIERTQLSEVELQKVCDFYIGRYNDCETTKQQETIRQDFILAIAAFNNRPVDDTIIKLVNEEIRKYGNTI
jgi:hypothetical protein